jgi:hypothetical protein
MTRIRRAAAAAAVLLVLAGGCSNEPSAGEWATQVCGALIPWRAEITDLNTRAAAEMADATTSTQTRDKLVALATGAESASETARARVAGAGVPDVDGGDAVARSFVSALTGTRDAYAQARTDLMALPTADEAAFYDGVVVVMARLDEAYRGSAVDLSAVSSPELKQAFDGLPACR